MGKRVLRILGANPVHPGRGAASYVRINIEHTDLASRPITGIVMTGDEAVLLAAEILRSGLQAKGVGRW